ncbi:hypothetical protein BCR34DRAFT_567641 [Clohesyomyces aquaticus]|uniref:REJ domain-containing protein n=1 Tax=Clohesyomyces aquaticus TaxID=1231657 RepID=A0A1Y1ZIJ1_9PLEO|nr:hypothetical protein BCR34DRAFT_567641 [Clohesyomyces aquaticus]
MFPSMGPLLAKFLRPPVLGLLLTHKLLPLSLPPTPRPRRNTRRQLHNPHVLSIQLQQITNLSPSPSSRSTTIPRNSGVSSPAQLASSQTLSLARLPPT